jgi:hypothetical protein
MERHTCEVKIIAGKGCGNILITIAAVDLFDGGFFFPIHVARATMIFAEPV